MTLFHPPLLKAFLMSEGKIMLKLVEKKIGNTVSGRVIHKELGVKGDYPTWVNRQINSFYLEENINYVSTFVDVGRGKEGICHYFTVDIAKHICLVSKTDKGREIRQELIDLEKKLNETHVMISKEEYRTLLDMTENLNKPEADKIFELGEFIIKNQKENSVDVFKMLVGREDSVKETIINAWEVQSFLKPENRSTPLPLYMSLYELGYIKRCNKGWECTDKGFQSGGKDATKFKGFDKDLIDMKIPYFPIKIWRKARPEDIYECQNKLQLLDKV